jgi:hypothetical protein
MDDARRRVETRSPELGRLGWAAAAIVVALWLSVAVWLLTTLLRVIR